MPIIKIMMKMKRRVVFIVLTIIILCVLFSRVDVTSAIETIEQANWWYLLAALLITFFFPILCAIRWNIIVYQLGIHLGVWKSFILIMAAWPLGTITPAKSGDLIKVLFLKNILSYSRTTGVILAERVMDVVALSLYGIVSGLLYGVDLAVWVCGCIFAGVVLFLLVIASPWAKLVPERFRQITHELLEAIKSLYLHVGVFLLILVITLSNWAMTFLQIWFCYKAFQASVPFLYIAAALPIAIFIGIIPVTLSGMGIRDGAIVFLFEQYAPYETNLAVGILYSIFGYWLLSIVGLPFMRAAFHGAIDGIREGELQAED